ncbi:MAG: DoxX family protein [Actinomycetota bacterium]
MAITAVVDPDQINLGLLILRVAVGATMVAHGYNHVWRGGKIAGTGRWFESLGMKPGPLHAWLASATELVAGAALIVGFFTPYAAGACAGVMLVALVVNHRKNGFFIFRPGEGWEYVGNLAAACFGIACLGPGEWSVDNATDFDLDGWWGLMSALVIGVGGTIGLLMTFWRPPPPKEATPQA